MTESFCDEAIVTDAECKQTESAIKAGHVSVPRSLGVRLRCSVELLDPR